MTKSIVLSVNLAWNVVNFRTSLINALQREGYKIVVLAPADNYAETLKQLRCDFFPINMDNGGTNPALDLRLLFDYYRLLSKIRPSCFLGYTAKPNIYGSMAAHLLRIPTVNNIAGLGAVFVRESWITIVMRILYRIALRPAGHVFFQNADDLDSFVSSGIVQSGAASIVPGSGVDTTRFAPRPCSPNGRFRFLLAARLLWDKGIGEYVEAARIVKKRHRDIDFCLLGFLDVANPTAVPRTAIETWEAEGVVSYLGSTDDVYSWIETADCVVLPSYREGTPRCLLEAASMAKPIITTDAVGCRNVVEDGVTGLLAEVRSARDLADKMERMLLLSAEERTRMGERGREKMIREYDEKFVIAQYLKAVGTLIGN